MQTFSDYIVYVDESGDTGDDPEFPVFCLAFCIFKRDSYTHRIMPDLHDLKFTYWGHECVILHENDMRRRKGHFVWLMKDRTRREEFFDTLNTIMAAAPFEIIASIINKPALRKKYAEPWNPYDVALHFCLERLHRFMAQTDDAGSTVHVIFESRGKREDKELELVFRRIISGERSWGWRRIDFGGMRYEPKFITKKANIIGLQLADLVARPLALRILRPDQENRAYDVLAPKIHEIKSFP